MTNYYKILGVPKDATSAQVKSAYRKLARQYHPDTTRLDPNIAAQKFREVQQAYEVLSDDSKRRAYDNPPPPPPPSKPKLEVSPSVLDFGTLSRGERRTKRFTINIRGGSVPDGAKLKILPSEEDSWFEITGYSTHNKGFPMGIDVTANTHRTTPGKTKHGWLEIRLGDLSSRVDLRLSVSPGAKDEDEMLTLQWDPPNTLTDLFYNIPQGQRREARLKVTPRFFNDRPQVKVKGPLPDWLTVSPMAFAAPAELTVAVAPNSKTGATASHNLELVSVAQSGADEELLAIEAIRINVSSPATRSAQPQPYRQPSTTSNRGSLGWIWGLLAILACVLLVARSQGVPASSDAEAHAPVSATSMTPAERAELVQEMLAVIQGFEDIRHRANETLDPSLLNTVAIGEQLRKQLAVVEALKASNEEWRIYSDSLRVERAVPVNNDKVRVYTREHIRGCLYLDGKLSQRSRDGEYQIVYLVEKHDGRWLVSSRETAKRVREEPAGALCPSSP